MSSESDEQFVERLAADRNGPIYEADFTRLFDLARRGAAAEDGWEEGRKAALRAQPVESETHHLQQVGYTFGWSQATAAYRKAIRALSPPPAGKTSDE